MNINTTKTVTLDAPTKRGAQAIQEVTLRKPNAGELRGLCLTDLLRIDTAAVMEVLPRITTPALTKQDVMAMDPADLMQLGTVVANFCVPKLRDHENGQEVAA